MNLEYNQLVRIFINEYLAERLGPVGMKIFVTPLIVSGNLSVIIDEREAFTGTSLDTRFINSTKSTKFGLLAYSVLYFDFIPGQNLEILYTVM
jgi:hypothetical protein